VSTAPAVVRTDPGRAGHTAAAVGTAPAVDRTDPAEVGRAAAVGVLLKADRTAAAAGHTVRAAVARTDCLGSARRAAAARSCSCRQDIGQHSRADLLAQLGHLYGDEHFRATAGVGAAQRCDIAVVAAVTDPHIAVSEPPAHRRVVRHPAPTPPLNP